MGMSQTTLTISGMHCASCIKLVTKTLKKIPGVTQASANLTTNQAYITSDHPPDMRQIDRAISAIGYQLQLNKLPDYDPAEENLNKARKKLLLAWLMSVPLILLMLTEIIIKMPMSMPVNIFAVVFSGLIIFLPGWNTLSTGFTSLFSGSASMNSLIALGTIAAFITGPLSLIFPNIPNFAIGGSLVMAFHLTGRFIEARAMGKTSQSIRKLLDLSPKTARIIINNREKTIDIRELKKGDILLVKPGEKIPADGIILSGSANIDESLITGESLPNSKQIQDPVIGSTINLDGLLKIKVTKIGESTFLSQIINLIRQAQGNQVPVQAFVDQVTGYFVPAILIISGLTFFAWLFLPIFSTSSTLPTLPTFSRALYASIAVLVIACPCALGLATPTALMVAVGMGAENGILIKNGSALEMMKKIKTVIFDKTGTLTQGKPAVTGIFPQDPSASPARLASKRADRQLTTNNLQLTTHNLLQIAASAESGSSHPLAQAIINYAKQTNIKLLPVTNFKNFPGQGISASINNQQVKIGTLKFLDLSHPPGSPNLSNGTLVHVSLSQKYLGSLSISDQVKEESPLVVSRLKQMGFNIFLLTGDNTETASVIAKQVGIVDENVFAGVLPHDKINLVKKLQKNSSVLFVGDGINDAPALSQADVGVAVASGTDIAIESADIVLVRKNLLSLVSAITLSQKAFTKIRQNLFWAFIYNILAIPIAALGLLHPVMAEMGMAFSSISVVVNANLLRKEKI